MSVLVRGCTVYFKIRNPNMCCNYRMELPFFVRQSLWIVCKLHLSRRDRQQSAVQPPVRLLSLAPGFSGALLAASFGAAVRPLAYVCAKPLLSSTPAWSSAAGRQAGRQLCSHRTKPTNDDAQGESGAAHDGDTRSRHNQADARSDHRHARLRPSRAVSGA